MAEKLQIIDAEKLSPEYWGNHSPADTCEWTEKPAYLREPFYDEHLRDSAEETIVNYLLETEGNPKPISTLKQGDTFDGTRLPEGTIIRYNREELRTTKKDTSWRNPYINFDLWGVVCKRINNDGEIQTVIIPFVDFSGYGEFLPSPTESPVLTVGQTVHRRTQSSSKDHPHMSESLVRVTSLEVHRIPS